MNAVIAPAGTLHQRALAGLPLRDVPGMPDVAVVDNHCHLGPYERFFQPGNGAAGLVHTLDRLGVAQACVFPTLSVTLDAHAGNELALAAGRAFPDRLLPYAVVDPHRPLPAIQDELQRCFDAGARGIKLHTSLADYPFDGPGYAVAFAFADAHRLPLISHGTGGPAVLRRVATDYPGAHFIVAHTGAGGGASEAYAALARALPNVYLDTASSTARFGAFLAVVAAAGADKILYGSDLPWMCASHQIGRVLLAPIHEADKRRILGETMLTLLGTRR